ncbi:MAG: glycosyltransferase family 39 protein [Bacteroidales bacterium]|nr:glycosyltransferase family 39 protein [Bacteroidales bacterium]
MNKPNKQIVILIVVCFFTYIFHNGVLVPDIMESRNIVTAREMISDGNWLVPTMNDVLRLEKPPLPTWIAAAVELVAPDNICAQRTMTGLAATMLVIFFFLFGAFFTKDERYSFISALILCTCYNIILMGRTASWDIYCHAFMMGAIYFLYKGLTLEGKQTGNFTWAGLMLGLSFLSKGPVSFYALLLPFIICLLIFKKGTLKGKMGPFLLMIGICIVLSSWWYIYLIVFHPEETMAVIDKETTAWSNHNVRPWYYYYQFSLETGVWSILLLVALAFPYWKKKMDNAPKQYLFPLAWMAILLFVLSCIPEKKPRYLLPMLIPASYTMGYIFNYWITKCDELTKTDKKIYRINTIAIAFIVTLIPIGIYIFLFTKGHISLLPFIILSLMLMTIAFVLWKTAVQIKPDGFLAGVVVLFLFTEIMLMPLIGKVANNTEMRSISATRDMEQLDNIPFKYNIANGEPRIEIIYAAYRKISPIDVNDAKAVNDALPFVLLTYKDIHEEVPEEILNDLKVTHIGNFDDNQRPKSARRYNNIFIFDLTLLEKK